MSRSVLAERFTHLVGVPPMQYLARWRVQLAATRLARYRSVPHAGLIVLGVALAARAALLPVAPSLSMDLHRYVWEGRVVVEGGDPYRQSPRDPGLAHLRDTQEPVGRAGDSIVIYRLGAP